MKKFLLSILSFAMLACGNPNPYKNVENNDSNYAVVPKPVRIAPSIGRFLVSDNTVISTSTDLSKEAEYLSEILRKFSGKTVTSKITETTSSSPIQLLIDKNLKHAEGYTLLVRPDSIIIKGKTAKGVFYGIQTLTQLIVAPTDQIPATTIPATTIEDYPRFGYRGMHLDVSRHYFPISFIKKYIDLIALHKMNTFHWHLTEDQGWRIEIKKYPKLTSIGAYRNGTIVGHFPGTKNDNKRTGGFYTQEQVKKIIQYAADRHVEIIPEIELPGHASAAIAAYPYLSCFPDEKTVVPKGMISKKGKALQDSGVHKIVQESWGVFDDVFCAGKESTFTFLEDVLDEVAQLFPSKMIHIGGDECPKSHWNRCPSCKKRMKEKGLKDAHELQSYFITRIEKYLNTKGKKIIGWDEILEGGLASNATVMSWRGEKGGIEAAKSKHHVIMTPTGYCYFDYYQAKPTGKEPLAIGGYLPVKKVYNYNPQNNKFSVQDAKYVLGTQGNIWTEYVPTPSKVEYMALPRMSALAEVAWTPQKDKNYNDFLSRMQHMRTLYDAYDYNYAKHIFSLIKK